MYLDTDTLRRILENVDFLEGLLLFATTVKYFICPDQFRFRERWGMAKKEVEFRSKQIS